MEANELRIGNWLCPDNETPQENNYQLTAHGLADQVLGDKYYGDPIPITDEWLEGFGFKKVGINYELRWLLLWRNKETSTIDFVVNEPNSGKRNARHLRYVHELQNLFFALTGEELTLKTETV